MDTYTRPDSAIWIPVQALYMHTLLVGGTAQRFQPSVNTHGLDVCRHTRPSRGRIPQGLPSAEAVGGTPQSATPLAETVSGGCPEGHPLTVSYSSHVHRSCRARKHDRAGSTQQQPVIHSQHTGFSHATPYAATINVLTPFRTIVLRCTVLYTTECCMYTATGNSNTMAVTQ